MVGISVEERLFLVRVWFYVVDNKSGIRYVFFGFLFGRLYIPFVV